VGGGGSGVQSTNVKSSAMEKGRRATTELRARGRGHRINVKAGNNSEGQAKLSKQSLNSRLKGSTK